MSAETTLIDEIVQRVLSELGTAPGAAPPQLAALSDTTASVVAFDAAVVTREMLEKGAGSATRIRLRAGAIVTPAARDFLREREIETAAETAAAPSRAATASPVRVLLTTSTPRLTAALATSRSAGVIDQSRIAGTPAEAASEATALLCRSEAQRVVVFSDEPELVACLANRNERIRAAALPSTTALDRLLASLKPNLFAVSPADRSEFETTRLLKAIHAS